jgi:hypothetical protein
MTNPVYKRAADLMEASVGEEILGLDARAGNCYGFNGVAASIWRKLENPKSFDELLSELIEEYEVDAEQCSPEVRAFLDDMLTQGLVCMED